NSNGNSGGGSKEQEDDEARATWREVFQLADNLELPELCVRTMSMIQQAQQVCASSSS
ncbi:hypothetical protein BGZ47_006698, partial [Haplosporangium gracile]